MLIHPDGATIVHMTVIATLVVTRPAQSGRAAYRIVVDGEVKGKISAGEELVLALAPGKHRIRARIDWTGSPELPVTLGSGATVKLKVEPRGLRHGLSRDGYLSLTREH
ncbi:hypothetical protein ACWKSP_04710 [Micromonosporaceae bacterium Da 78-11]